MSPKLLAIIGLLLLTLPASAQETPVPLPSPSRPGGAAIDPSENVKALSEAANKRQDDLRLMESKYQNAMRDAETRRVNELAAQKQLFDLELARVLRANVDSAALLLSTQLKEVKTDLSDRTSKLEQFRWESGGRGAGIGDAYGWMLAGIMALVTVVALFWKRAPAA